MVLNYCHISNNENLRVAWNAQIWIDEHSSCTVQVDTEHSSQRIGRDTRGPNGIRAFDPSAIFQDKETFPDGLDASVKVNIHPQRRQAARSLCR